MFATAIALLLCMSVVPPETPPGESNGPDVSTDISKPLHLEEPDDKPAPPERSVRGVGLPPVVVQLGPFRSVQVNVEPCTGKNLLADAANEPSIAIDPNNPNRIAIGWRQFDNVASNFRQAGWAYSSDGGATWTAPGVLDPNVFRSDPVLASDPDGTFLYYSLKENFTCDMYRSVNGGRTWSAPIPAFGGDKAWIAVDQTGGMGRGHVYAIWSEFAGCCPGANFTRSVDAGVTFDAPILTPSFPIHGTMSVGPNGELYICGRALFPEMPVLRSCDAQDPMVVTPTFDVDALVDMGGGSGGGGPNPGGLLGQGWIATDHSDGLTRGNVYLLQSIDPPGPDPLDVMFARSTNGGVTWTPPIRVNDDVPATGVYQWFGTMSVAPDGRIDAIWNDMRNDPDGVISELYYTNSRDAGDTWATSIPISPPFNHFVGYPNQNKIGDYYDMISDERGVNIAYAATFNGEQDVYFLNINANDCNSNDVIDVLDIDGGTSLDANEDGVPDECGQSPIFGAAIFVDASATGTGDGSNWTNALTDLQSALTMASTISTTSEVRVAQGVYHPTAATGDRSISFPMLDGVSIKGGYRGVAGGASADQREPSIYVTELSGDLNSDDAGGGNRTDNSYHIVTAANGAAHGVLDGFLITGGQADGGSAPDTLGGGAYIFGQCQVVRNCTFQDNVASSSGGAIYAEQTTVLIENCRFEANAAATGGAISNRDATATIDGCRFTGNEATSSSGGAVVNLRTTMNLFNSAFSGNTAALTGGAIRNGVDFSNINNCTFAYNVAGTEGGGIYNRPSITAIRNCILWNNTDAGGTDESAQVHVVGSAPIVKSCIITDGWSEPGGANIIDDPIFVELSGQDDVVGTVDDDYLLAPCSPAIDAGTSGLFAELSVDESGAPRVIDGDGDLVAVIDIGAVEHFYMAPATGDIDGDGLVSGDDFDVMIGCVGGPDQPITTSGNIGVDACRCAFDTDADNDIDLRDFAILIDGWPAP